MADEQSTHAALSSAVNTYYEKRILQDFEPKTQFYRFAPVTTEIPLYMGKTVQFTRYRKIDPLYTDNSNEFAAHQSYLSAVIVSATLHERDSYVQLSELVALTAIGNALDQAATKVQEQAVKTLDKLVRNDIGMMVADVANATSLNYANMAIDGGTLNSTGVTSRVWSHDRAAGGDRFPMYHNKIRLAQSAQVTSFAASGMTIKTLQHGVSILMANDIPKLSDGNYMLITHPTVAYQMTTNAGFKGWFSHTTSDPARRDPTEVGIVAGVKIVHSTQAFRFPLSGDTMDVASGNLYCSLLFGQEAYGVTSLSSKGGRSGFKFYLKESGPQSTNDPTNKIKQAAFSITAVAKVLNKSAGIWLLTTATS